MNPIFNATNVQPLQYNINQLYKLFCSKGNPMQLFMMIAGNNPQMKPIVEMIKNGTNPEQLARQLLTQKVINPDDFVKSLANQ